LYKKNMNSSILFTDATIFVNKNNLILLKNYVDSLVNNTDNDIFFVYLAQDPINIGVMLLKCNETNLVFWETVLNRMNNLKKQGRDAWDQGIIKQLLIREKYPIKYDYFDINKVWAGGQMPKEKLNDFFIYKSCVNPQSNRQLTRLTYLYNLELITKEEYEYWLNK